MGILPLQFKDNQSADTLELTGKERFTIHNDVVVNKPNIEVIVETDTGKRFSAISRLDTEVEINYYQNGGILQTVLRRLLNE